MVKNMAAMNLKKYPGGERADKQLVKKEAKKDIDLLRREIALYSPNIILTDGWCLVFDFLHDDIFQDATPWYDSRKRADAARDPNLWYFWTEKVHPGKRTLVISMPHPNRAAKAWTYELQKVLKKEHTADEQKNL